MIVNRFARHDQSLGIPLGKQGEPLTDAQQAAGIFHANPFRIAGPVSLAGRISSACHFDVDRRLHRLRFQSRARQGESGSGSIGLPRPSGGKCFDKMEYVGGFEPFEPFFRPSS
jgi:hypothetical protein